jgi:hypothetical protein
VKKIINLKIEQENDKMRTKSNAISFGKIVGSVIVPRAGLLDV